jgi:hypothetical protein
LLEWRAGEDEIPCEEVGTIEVKGFLYPIQTYLVLQKDVTENDNPVIV